LRVSNDLLKKIVLALKDGNIEEALELSEDVPLIIDVNTDEWEFAEGNVLTLNDLTETLIKREENKRG
jgi:hypothetical protein